MIEFKNKRNKKRAAECIGVQSTTQLVSYNTRPSNYNLLCFGIYIPICINNIT